MEISLDKHKTKIKHHRAYLTFSHTLQSLARWLTWLFSFTEEDRIKAGISVGGGEQDTL